MRLLGKTPIAQFTQPDMTTNLGDTLDYGGSYAAGGYSDYNLYVYGVQDSFSGDQHAYVVCNIWQLRSVEPILQFGILKTTRDMVGCMLTPSLSMAYLTAGGSTDTDKHNYITEVMYSAGSAPAGPTPGDSYGNVAAWFGEIKGWTWKTGQGGNFTFATETWASGGTTVATDGWGKALPTKHGHAYVKNGGNIVTGAYKLNDTTGAQIRTDLNFDNSGEENYQTGQDWGYCVGHL